ncbi:MAG: Crp/Fnr family transcriptional regulator [Pyrinomonadaceae bacterium]
MPEVADTNENQLLASLPSRDRDRLSPQLEKLSFYFGEIIHKCGEEITHVYFPLTCIVVLVSSVDDKATVEVGLIGKEGMVGTAILMGAKAATSHAIVQCEGKGLRLPANVLKKELRRNRAIRDVLLPYANAALAQSTQLAACHRYHTPQARLARWLLMTHERTHREELKITQDFIAQLLGTRRATITEASRALQNANLISSGRGRVRILDVAGLEAEACSCYQIIRSQS